MRLVAPDPGSVVTFHELARDMLERAGTPVEDFTGKGAFDAMAARFVALRPGLRGVLSTIVVDEGQDFDQSWADTVLALATPDARLLWLEDPEQSLYDRPPVELPGWASLSSPVNYRSPRLLVEFMNWLRLTAEPVEAGGPVPGFDPGWIYHDDGTSPVDATAQAIDELRSRGFATGSIAVLSYRGLDNSAIAGPGGPATLAGLRLARPAGYDASGVALRSEGELLVDTVHRFKGQAADAVVVTEVDFAELGQKERRRLFVALSRARLHAAIVASARASAALRRELES